MASYLRFFLFAIIFFWVAQTTYGWVEVPGGGRTNTGPAAVVYNNRLYLFVVGLDNRIFVNTFDGSGWSGWFPSGFSPVPGSENTRDIAVYAADRLYLYQETFGSEINSTSTDGTTWSAWAAVPGSAGSTGPAAIMFKGSGYLFVRSVADNSIHYFATHLGKWTPINPGTDRALSQLAATVFNDELFLVYRGLDNSINYVRSTDGSNWSPSLLINPATDRTTSGPAATVVDTRLHVVFRAPDNRLFTTSSLDGTNWTASTEVPPGGGLTDEAPTATVFNSPLLVFVKALNSQTIHMNQSPPQCATGAPTVTSIQPEVIRNEEITDVIVNGWNLCASSVSIPRDPNDPRVLPTAVLLDVNPQGTQMTVRINATDDRILDAYRLVVTNQQFGSGDIRFRVIPFQRPLWDVMTPGTPAGGSAPERRAYLLDIAGYNLQNANLVAEEPWKISFSNLQYEETGVTGVLEVLPNAPLGYTYLRLDGPGGCTPQYYYYCRIRIQIVQGGGLLAEENITAGLPDPSVPPLYLAKEGLAVREGPGIADATPEPAGGVYRCVLPPRRIFSINLQRSFVFCRGLGSFSDACLRGMQLGQVAPVSSFVLSIFFEVDFSVWWYGNRFCVPLSYPWICFRAVAGAEVPGCCGAWASFDFCLGRPEGFNPRAGATTQLDHLGGQCFDVVNQWWQPGPQVVRHADIQLTDCCSETLRTSSAGSTFLDTRFQRTFSLPDRPVAPVTQRGDCNVALSCTPATLTRGQNTTCTATVTGAPPEAPIRYTWRFSDGTTTVNGPDGIGSRTWSGTMVSSGTVYVRVRVGTARRDIEKSATLTVNNRSGFAFTAVQPAQVPNGSICEATQTPINLPSPPTQAPDLGQSCLTLRGSVAYVEIVDNGPNTGFKYVTSVSDTREGRPTRYTFTINPDLENPNSQFCRAQCGNYDPVQRADGFISCANLHTNTRRHEAGTRESHWRNYEVAQSDPANNVGIFAEREIGRPSDTLDRFRQRLETGMISRFDNIHAAFSVHPLDVNYREDGTFQGFINFAMVPCP